MHGHSSRKAMKKIVRLVTILLLFGLLSGCGSTNSESANAESANPETSAADESGDLEENMVAVSLEGGSGKAGIESPAQVKKEDGQLIARICWSSPYYDYMLVDGETYYPVNSDGNSVFEIPIPSTACSLAVQADTTAMSQAHLIDYTLTFGESEASGDSSAKTEESKTELVSRLDDLEYTGSMELDYAEQFKVDYYEDGIAMITIADDDQFLLIPEGVSVPDTIPEQITILQQPMSNIYLVASAAMDMFAACDGMDSLGYCALKESDWYISQAKEAMENGSLTYAGKYSAPDYELLCAGGCELAIENTMVLHSPEVIEELENLDIPVMIDHSSYETSPQGRMEWVKLYGLLSGHLEDAEKAYEKQMEQFDALENIEKSGRTAAFFYVTTSGMVSVRNSNDYIPKLIEEAGGSYVFSDIGADSNNATSNIQLEEFYARTKDADYLIYNSSIAGELDSLEDFLDLSPLFSDMKAVKEGHVYCTRQNLYQSSMEMGDFVADLSKMLTDQDGKLSYLYKLE